MNEFQMDVIFVERAFLMAGNWVASLAMFGVWFRQRRPLFGVMSAYFASIAMASTMGMLGRNLVQDGRTWESALHMEVWLGLMVLTLYGCIVVVWFGGNGKSGKTTNV